MGIVTMRRKLRFLQDAIGLRCGFARSSGVAWCAARGGLQLAPAAPLRTLAPLPRASLPQRRPGQGGGQVPARAGVQANCAAPTPPLVPQSCSLCSNADLAKVVAKFPRILEYKSERTLRPRIEFLTGQCGVAEADLAKVRDGAGLGSVCARLWNESEPRMQLMGGCPPPRAQPARLLGGGCAPAGHRARAHGAGAAGEGHAGAARRLPARHALPQQRRAGQAGHAAPAGARPPGRCRHVSGMRLGGGRQAGGSRGTCECGAEPAHGAWGCLPRAMRTGRRRETLPPPLLLWQPAG